MLLNIPTNILLNTLACSTGLAVFAYFASSGCDPLANNEIDNSNQVMLSIFVLLQSVSIACYAALCVSYGRVVSLSVCLSVSPSVCLSHAGTLSKRCKLGSLNLHRRIAQGH